MTKSYSLRYPFYIIRGNTFEFDINVSDIGESVVSNIYFSCKVKWTDDEYVFQKKIDDGIEDCGNGLYHVKLAPADTEDLEPGTYSYDIEIVINDEDVFTILYGSIHLKEDITREKL